MNYRIIRNASLAASTALPAMPVCVPFDHYLYRALTAVPTSALLYFAVVSVSLVSRMRCILVHLPQDAVTETASH